VKISIKRFSLLALILIPLAAISAPKAIQVFKISNQQMAIEINEVTSGTSDQPLTPKQAQSIIGVMVDVARMSNGMTLPPNVRLNISQISFSPSANALVDELNLGVVFAQLDEKNRVHKQNPSVMRAITAHEFGHLIFTHNIVATKSIRTDMARYAREAGEIESLLKKMRDEAEKLQALATSQGGISPELQAQMDKLEAEFNEWLEELQKAQNKNKDVLALYERTSPYNEFFADVVSLLYTENPNAIAESIHFTVPKVANHKLVKSDILSREFEAGKPDHHSPRSPHALFAQVRHQLWDSYLKRPSVMSKKALVLNAVARAVDQEVAWILTKKRIPTDPRVVRVLNERLWKAIGSNLEQTLSSSSH
jgi:hypothetical protein